MISLIVLTITTGLSLLFFKLAYLSIHIMSICALRFPWRDGIFDVTWSEVSEPVLVAAGADGGVVIFDQTVPQVTRTCLCYDALGR